MSNMDTRFLFHRWVWLPSTAWGRKWMNCQSCPFIVRRFILPTQTLPAPTAAASHSSTSSSGSAVRNWNAHYGSSRRQESSGQSGCQSVGDFALTRLHLRAKRSRISDDLQRSSESNKKALTVTRGVNYTAAVSDVLTGCRWSVSDWAAAPDIIHWM